MCKFDASPLMTTNDTLLTSNGRINKFGARFIKALPGAGSMAPEKQNLGHKKREHYSQHSSNIN